MLAANIIAVTDTPSSGVPEESSKIEPTAAIAVIQEPIKNKPLFGVIYFRPHEWIDQKLECKRQNAHGLIHGQGIDRVELISENAFK